MKKQNFKMKNEFEALPFSSHNAMLNDVTIAGQPIVTLIDEIQALYLRDNRPWIIGFSGGKDSTVVLSLVFSAIQRLAPTRQQKAVYVVSSNTLVETPVVIDLAKKTLKTINQAAKNQSLPISAHTVFPAVNQTFWVNLLGRGYPAPSNSFRWCTERMKINPVSAFITQKVAEFGEVIIVLGSRSQESASRAQVIAKHRIDNSVLSRHVSLPNAYTYMPIEKWTVDEVWEYLMSAPTPWGSTNRTLFELYKGSNHGECPLVIDKSTPSCGNSRFGCWTCTVVSEDKSLRGLIESGEEWMKPLLEFRNKLYKSSRSESSHIFRNFKRRNGQVTFDNKNTDATEKKIVRGPYWLKYRKEWLKELLEIEKILKSNGHETELISEDELKVIRQEWLKDPNEPDWEDSLPRIYAEVYPNEEIEWIENDLSSFGETELSIMNELSSLYQIPPEMIKKLLEVEIAQSHLDRRKGIVDQLSKILAQEWDSFEQVSNRRYELDHSDIYAEKLKYFDEQYQMIADLKI